MNFIKNFIKDKTVVFYIACGVALLALVTAIVYAATLGHLEEMSWVAFGLLVAVPFVFAGLSLVGYERLGAAAIGILSFAAFVLYVTSIYEYPMAQLMIITSLSDLKEFAAIIAAATLMLICCITGNVVYWLRMRQESPEAESEKTEVAAK